jgi:hypothetical protein
MAVIVPLAWHRRHNDVAHVLGLEVRVALEFVPRVVKGELCDLVNLVAALEQAAGGLMPEVMEMQILDAEDAACTGERRADALGIKRKDVLGPARLAFYDCPGLWGVLEAAVIAFLVPRMFRIPHQAGPADFVVVDPFQTRDFRLSSRRGDGEVDDRQHGNIRAPVTRGEVLAQARKFLRCRTPRASWATSGRTGSSLTLHAARSTTPIQIRSFITVAGPAPSARRRRT